jgi:hypothetical protein
MIHRSGWPCSALHTACMSVWLYERLYDCMIVCLYKDMKMGVGVTCITIIDTLIEKYREIYYIWLKTPIHLYTYTPTRCIQPASSVGSHCHMSYVICHRYRIYRRRMSICVYMHYNCVYYCDIYIPAAEAVMPQHQRHPVRGRRGCKGIYGMAYKRHVLYANM